MISVLKSVKLLEYFGVVLVMIGVILIAMPKIEGQMLMVLAQIVWAVFALKNKHWGLFAQSCVLFVISLYALYSWNISGIG